MRFGEEIICSRQNKNLVELCKLNDRKTRELTRSFRFDGVKLLEEAMKNDMVLTAVFLSADRAEEIIQKLQDRFGGQAFSNVGKILFVAEDIFERISEEKSPEGVISVAKYIDKFQKNVTIYNSADFLSMKNQHIVLLESVRDPSNIGAVIRSAAALGVDRLIMSEDCADIYNSRAVRASMGTVFNQPIDRVRDLTEVIRGLAESGRRVFAAVLDERAKVLGDFSIQPGDCVVVGNEGHGLSSQTVGACTHSVMIPMSNRAESLNAAVATSILMWEFGKQK